MKSLKYANYIKSRFWFFGSISTTGVLSTSAWWLSPFLAVVVNWRPWRNKTFADATAERPSWVDERLESLR